MPPLVRAPGSNPEVLGAYQSLGVGNVVANHMVAIPRSKAFLFMERPSGKHPDESTVIAGYYDVDDYGFVNVDSTDYIANCGHTLTSQGDVVIVGGSPAKSGYEDGTMSIRIFNSTTRLLTVVSNMTFPRWYPTATALADGRILIMGGTKKPGAGQPNNPLYEIWDPSRPTVATTQVSLTPEYIKAAGEMFYPFNWVLPDGNLFTWCQTYGEIIRPADGVRLAVLPKWSNISKLIRTEYPYSSSGVMLPLTPDNNYTPEFLIIGGQYSYGWVNTTASNVVFRMRVGINGTNGGQYTLEPWSAETMPLARVMSDTLLLPNGMLIIINGAQVGLAGDAAAKATPKANNPAFWPVLYDPEAPKGSRMTQLERSQIARLYQSTASLTPDGSILVAGCDRCSKFWSNVSYSENPTGMVEYRVEVFRPPMWYNFSAKPIIKQTPGDMAYGAVYGVLYDVATPTAEVTSAVLVAPSATTHGTNMNQRVVQLQVVTHNRAQHLVILQGPPNKNIAPPGSYMLFLLNQKVYSESVWVTLA